MPQVQTSTLISFCNTAQLLWLNFVSHIKRDARRDIRRSLLCNFKIVLEACRGVRLIESEVRSPLYWQCVDIMTSRKLLAGFNITFDGCEVCTTLFCVCKSLGLLFRSRAEMPLTTDKYSPANTWRRRCLSLSHSVRTMVCYIDNFRGRVCRFLRELAPVWNASGCPTFIDQSSQCT